MIEKKFKLYQGVKVLSSRGRGKYRASTGHIVGFVEDEEIGIFYKYGVYLDEVGELLRFEEKELEATGEQFQESDFYDGTVIHVSQKGEILPPRDE